MNPAVFPFAFLLAAVLAFPAAAQDWPKQKSIHIVVGFAPASTTDLVARLVAPKLSDALGQSVIVENKAVRDSGARAD